LRAYRSIIRCRQYRIVRGSTRLLPIRGGTMPELGKHDELTTLVRAALSVGWQAVTYQVNGEHQSVFVLVVSGDPDYDRLRDHICDILFACGHTPGITTMSPYHVKVFEARSDP
jgi:hypothetical protein